MSSIASNEIFLPKVPEKTSGWHTSEARVIGEANEATRLRSPVLRYSCFSRVETQSLAHLKEAKTRVALLQRVFVSSRSIDSVRSEKPSDRRERTVQPPFDVREAFDHVEKKLGNIVANIQTTSQRKRNSGGQNPRTLRVTKNGCDRIDC